MSLRRFAAPSASCSGVRMFRIVGCDLGNSAIKLVLRQANGPQLRMFRFESIYTPAAMIRAGDDTTSLRVFRNGAWSEWFWIDQGDTVGGEALPIGATAERLADPRIVDFLVGALVVALEDSGWLPGDYTLWVGFGVPNEEVSRAGLVADTLIETATQTRGQSLFAALHPILADHRRFPIVAGGGAACLHTELDARAAAAQRTPDSYLIVPEAVTSTLNAVGLFALALYTAQREA